MLTSMGTGRKPRFECFFFRGILSSRGKSTQQHRGREQYRERRASVPLGFSEHANPAIQIINSELKIAQIIRGEYRLFKRWLYF